MKHVPLLVVCVLCLSSGPTVAQTASDYYLPLRVGNFLLFQSSDRTTTYSIIRTDSIAGYEYVLEMRSEVMTGTGESKVYALFWLREDSAGSVLLGAMGVTGSIDGSWSANLDSATIFDPPGLFFSNACVVPGYTSTYSMEDYTWTDTTMSNTETVQTTAGTFVNCIKMRQTKRLTSNDSLIYVEYTYYAQGLGIVKVAREGSPANDLVSYSAATSVEAGNESAALSRYALHQNYPNPFNPSTSISFSLPVRSFVTVRVVDLLGREVSTIVSEELQTGTYTRQWNAVGVPSGVYFLQLQAGRYQETKKIVVLK